MSRALSTVYQYLEANYVHNLRPPKLSANLTYSLFLAIAPSPSGMPSFVRLPLVYLVRSKSCRKQGAGSVCPEQMSEGWTEGAIQITERYGWEPERISSAVRK